jgi:hypothetical protein
MRSISNDIDLARKRPRTRDAMIRVLFNHHLQTRCDHDVGAIGEEVAMRRARREFRSAADVRAKGAA